MAEASNTLVSRFNGISRQPVTRQLALFIGLAASIALGIGLVQWGFNSSFKPLYGAMAPGDTNDVIRALETNGFEYRLDNRTGMVSVAADELMRARIALASDGYPRGDGVGFESLYKEQEIGVSSFMEQARYHRALEQELSRTISAMEGVRASRVHLAMAKQSAFLRQREKPAASVMMQLYSGKTLNERQLAGVIHLVSSSVPNLQAEQVSVVDQQGRLLSGQGSDEDFGYTKEQYRLASQLEQQYSERILDIVEPILGYGKARAQVVADVDFTRIERTSEQYAPETVVRSEQTSEQTMNGSFAGAGVPGTLSNQPPTDGQFQEQAPAETLLDAEGNPIEPAKQRLSTRSTRNFEMDKTISHVKETPGSIQKLSVAVVLDYLADENGEPIALEQTRIDEITQLIRDAVGFDAERGDTVSVINAPFVSPPELEPIEEPSFLEQPLIWTATKGVLVTLGIGALILFVLRPVMQFSVAAAPQALAAPNNAGGQQRALAAGGGAGNNMQLSDDQLTLGGQQGASQQQGGLAGGYQQQLQMARNVAQGEPQRAAQVVKGWVAADG